MKEKSIKIVRHITNAVVLNTLFMFIIAVSGLSYLKVKTHHTNEVFYVFLLFFILILARTIYLIINYKSRTLIEISSEGIYYFKTGFIKWNEIRYIHGFDYYTNDSDKDHPPSELIIVLKYTNTRISICPSKIEYGIPELINNIKEYTPDDFPSLTYECINYET